MVGRRLAQRRPVSDGVPTTASVAQAPEIPVDLCLLLAFMGVETYSAVGTLKGRTAQSSL